VPNIGNSVRDLFPGCFVLQDVPVLSEWAVGDSDDVRRDLAAGGKSLARETAVNDDVFLVSEDHAAFVSHGGGAPLIGRKRPSSGAGRI
jgi:hypothetical protein